jgi:hypothetical protein
MSKPKTKTIVLYTGDNDDESNQKAVATLTAPRIVIVSQYADLRGEQGELIATITWTSPVKAREI